MSTDMTQDRAADRTADGAATTKPRSQKSELSLLPPVDIVEDASGITLTADLPGVDRSELSIGVDGRTLTIEAPLRFGEADSLVSVYAEVRANHYRRSFELSSELDTAAVEASLKDGVLTLHLPKLERAKPRRIDVRVGE
ncbi:MAG: Hsp20/alpha crystallin family protein [Pseudomonadota bacterium]|nr:Hsp20/alpha crystallin family protein [Pseudomonadota bacterium]